MKCSTCKNVNRWETFCWHSGNVDEVEKTGNCCKYESDDALLYWELGKEV